MNIPVTLATNCKPRPFPVWAVRARAAIVFEKCCFMPCSGGSLLGTGGLLQLLMLDLWPNPGEKERIQA